MTQFQRLQFYDSLQSPRLKSIQRSLQKVFRGSWQAGSQDGGTEQNSKCKFYLESDWVRQTLATDIINLRERFVVSHSSTLHTIEKYLDTTTKIFRRHGQSLLHTPLADGQETSGGGGERQTVGRRLLLPPPLLRGVQLRDDRAVRPDHLPRLLQIHDGHREEGLQGEQHAHRGGLNRGPGVVMANIMQSLHDDIQSFMVL